MCIEANRLTSTTKLPKYGWKVAVKDDAFDNRFTGPYYGGISYKVGETVCTGVVRSIMTTDGDWYISGFHLFTSRAEARRAAKYIKPDARDKVVLKVAYNKKNVLAFGVQHPADFICYPGPDSIVDNRPFDVLVVSAMTVLAVSR